MSATAQRNVRNAYTSTSVATASPQQLVVLLYDRLHRDLSEAVDFIGANNIYDANRTISHAQDIIVELHAALDQTAWEHAPALGGLYVWFLAELTEANLKKDAERIGPVLRMVDELRDSWRAAAAQVSAAAVPAAPFSGIGQGAAQ